MEIELGRPNFRGGGTRGVGPGCSRTEMGRVACDTRRYHFDTRGTILIPEDLRLRLCYRQSFTRLLVGRGSAGQGAVGSPDPVLIGPKELTPALITTSDQLLVVGAANRRIGFTPIVVKEARASVSSCNDVVQYLPALQ